MITGAGRAFSAGGDFNYLDELRNDEALRQKTIKHGRDLVIGMVRCRIPVVAAVNGPAVGLGLQPGRALGHRLHRRDCVLRRPARVDRPGGRGRWPAGVAVADQHVAGQGIRVHRGADQGRSGQSNWGWPTTSSPIRWPRRSRARRRSWSCRSRPLEATKRLMNIQLEKSVMASLDYANLSEYVSFGTADFNKIVDGLIAKN